VDSDVTSVVLEWTQARNRHAPDAFAAFLNENGAFADAGLGRRSRDICGSPAACHSRSCCPGLPAADTQEAACEPTGRRASSSQPS
jgi:hypothetical protein